MQEVELDFYKRFKLSPKIDQFCHWECRDSIKEYVACHKKCEHQRYSCVLPEITNTRLIELIAIGNKYGAIALEGISSTTVRLSVLERLTAKMIAFELYGSKEAEFLLKEVQAVFDV